MSKTRAELVQQALVNLGVVAEGQSVSDDMVSKMDKIVDPACAELAELDVYYVQDPGTLGPSDGAIEDSAFLSLAAYIANAACAAFNLPADAKLQVLSQIAEGKLVTLSRPAKSRRTLRMDPAMTSRRIYRGGLNG